MTGIEGWREEVAAALADGYAWPDVLCATDHGDRVEVVARLLRPADGSLRAIAMEAPAGASLPSVADLVPGFGWQEAEAVDLVGVRFEPDPGAGPCLRRDPLGPPPLAHGTVMAARAVRPWPGAAEPGMRVGAEGMARRTGNPSRRRQRPPAVPDEWLEP